MDHLGQLLDAHRRSSSSQLRSSSESRSHSRTNSHGHSHSNSGCAPPPPSSSARAVTRIPLSPESASSASNDDYDDHDDDSNDGGPSDDGGRAMAEILAVTPSPPPAKKRGGTNRSRRDRRRNGTNPFDDDDNDDDDKDHDKDQGGMGGGGEAKAKSKSRTKTKKSSRNSSRREAKTGKTSSGSSGGKGDTRKKKPPPQKLRMPPPQPTTNPFDDDDGSGGGSGGAMAAASTAAEGKPPPSPRAPARHSRTRSANATAKTKSKTRTHRRSETAPAPSAAAVQALDDRPPPLAELAIRTRSFVSSAGKSRTSSSRSRTGGEEGGHAVGSVVSGKSAKSGRSAKSGKSSTNPFEESSSSGSESDVSDHDDRWAAAAGDIGHGPEEGPGDGDEDDSQSQSSAASTHVSDLSLRSARSVALAAALAAQAERYRAAAAAAAAKEDDAGNASDESRWEEGSDGEWRRVVGGGGGGKTEGKADATNADATDADAAHEEDGRWEEGSDGEWRRVVDDDDADKAKDKVKDDAAPQDHDASKEASSSDDDEESSRELWEEGSDGEWRRVVKSKDNDVTDKNVDAVDDKPDAAQADEGAPLEEEGVWEEDSDGEWRLVPKTKTKTNADDDAQAPAEPSAEDEGEGAGVAEAKVEEGAAKTAKPKKHKLNPFDDSSSGSNDGSDGEGQAEASHSSSGPVDLDGSDADDSDGEDGAPEEGSGPIDLDEVDSIDAEEKDGSGPIDLDEVDSLVASDHSEKDAVSSSSSESAENDSDELDDELREQIERRRAEEAAAAVTASANAAQHPLLADPMTPRYALDHSVSVVPKDSSSTGPSLLARARAKREAEERVKAELAEKRAREREMFGIPQAIGGASFEAASSVMSPGDNKSHAEVSTTANSTLQRSVKSYGDQSEASSANAVAILPSLVNVQALSDLDRIPSGRRIDQFSSASPSHRRVEPQDSNGGGGSGSANALSAREAIMAAASRHRSRFGSSRGHVARVSFDSNDPTASVKSADSNSTGPSQTSGRPPLLDRSSRAASLGKKFMTPLERQRELRRSHQMAAVASAVEGAANFDQDRLGRTGPGLGDSLARLKEISGEDVSVVARGDDFSIAPSLGGTVATEVTDQKPDGNDTSLAAVAESDEPLKKTTLPTMDESEEVSETPVLRDFNAGLLRGFADTSSVSSSPAQSPSRPASSPGSSPRRRMNAARSKMKNVLSTMATVDKMKKSPTKQSPRKTLVRPNFEKEEQEVKSQAKAKIPSNMRPLADNNANVSADAPDEEDAPITKDSSSEEAEAESDSDDESVGGASLDFGELSKPAALPLRQHPDYSKYFAMLKASVPPSFVRRVCEIDGRDPAVLDMDPETPYEPQKNGGTSPIAIQTDIDDGDNDNNASSQPTKEGRPLAVETDGSAMATEAESNDPSPRGVADISVSKHTSGEEEATDDASDESTTKPDTSKVAALFANRSAPLTAASKPPRPPPGKFSDSGKGDVAALFAARSAESDTKPKGPAPGKLKDVGKGDVAKLFASRSAESNGAKDKPKPGKLSDTGKGDVAAMFESRAAEDVSSKKDQAKPGKLADSGKGDVAALFAARTKAAKPAVAPTVELSTPVSAAAEKIEQKEQENKDASRPPLKRDPEFAKYFKMLSMGIPVGAVQQALARDGKDPSIMEMDHDKPYSSKPESTEPERPPLREDPEFAKYFKMLKMKLPMGAVKQAMTRDGVNPSIMDMDHDKPLPNVTSSTKEADVSAKKKSPARPKVLRKKLFWTSIDKSKLDKDSLWAQAQQESQNLEGLDYDMEEFASLFTQQKGKKGKSPSRDGPKRKKKATVQLIDGRRDMNGSIVLRKFKHNYKQLADDLRKLDVGSMDENEVRAHMQLLPTKDEIKSIEAYLSKSKTDEEKEEAISKLGECEKYMIAMMGVQDAAKKFQCLLYKAQFDNRVEELEAEVKDLKEACKCVRSSDRLRKLLVFALRLGNTLNTDGSGESASAITLDSLLKMHEAKAFDKQTSVLHYLVSIIDKNDNDVLNVKEDLEPAKKAERIVVESLKKTLSDLSDGLDTVNEMGMEEAQRQAKGKDDKNMVADVNSVLAQTNIGQFAISADVRLKVLGAELNEAVEACSSLLKYFGEDAVMPSDVFFSTLNGFIAMFGTALEDNRRREKAKARKAKLAEKQKSEGGSSSRTNSFTLRQASGSESSLADSRSKILQELSTGEALSKLKPIGQSSASRLSVDSVSSKKDDEVSSTDEKKEQKCTDDNTSGKLSEKAPSEEESSTKNCNSDGMAKDGEEIEESDEDEAFEDAIETDEVSEKQLEAFGDASDSQEEQKEECVIS